MYQNKRYINRNTMFFFARICFFTAKMIWNITLRNSIYTFFLWRNIFCQGSYYFSKSSVTLNTVFLLARRSHDTHVFFYTLYFFTQIARRSGKTGFEGGVTSIFCPDPRYFIWPQNFVEGFEAETYRIWTFWSEISSPSKPRKNIIGWPFLLTKKKI